MSHSLRIPRKEAAAHQLFRARHTAGDGSPNTAGDGSPKVPCFDVPRVDDQEGVIVRPGGCLFGDLTVEIFHFVDRSRGGLRAEIAQLSADGIERRTVDELHLATFVVYSWALLQMSYRDTSVGIGLGRR